MSQLRLAVVGAGAAGMYAVQHLLEQTAVDVRIDLFEYLPTPWGLIRTGVAPDHPEKKQITDRLFELYLKHEKVRFFGNVGVGSDLRHQDLAARYHAVIYAVGANDDRSLEVPGEDLPGSWSARQFVAWYNGHPDFRDLHFDLSDPRAIIVGTGNVALDVARILTLPPAELARSDIADHALAALRESQVREAVLLGRRGCHDGAFNNPELEELVHLDGVEVRVEAEDLHGPEPETWEARRKVATLRQLAARRVPAAERRIVFKFDHAPEALVGPDRVRGFRMCTPSGSALLSCGLVLRAIGYRGTALPGVPFDDRAGVIPNLAGRVTDGSGPCPGLYVTGWIKRGPRGVIGSNKWCAAETVANLLADAAAGLPAPLESGDIADLLASRGCRFVSYGGWQRIDGAERRAGWAQGRPRIKQTRIEDLLAIAAPELAPSRRDET
jgi:ferredoxin/flavodoxin---NADP+ reductase